MKKFNFSFSLREAFVWVAIMLVVIGLIAEHFVARNYEDSTRAVVKQMLEQLFSQAPSGGVL